MNHTQLSGTFLDDFDPTDTSPKQHLEQQLHPLETHWGGAFGRPMATPLPSSRGMGLAPHAIESRDFREESTPIVDQHVVASCSLLVEHPHSLQFDWYITTTSIFSIINHQKTCVLNNCINLWYPIVSLVKLSPSCSTTTSC